MAFQYYEGKKLMGFQKSELKTVGLKRQCGKVGFQLLRGRPLNSVGIWTTKLWDQSACARHKLRDQS